MVSLYMYIDGPNDTHGSCLVEKPIIFNFIGAKLVPEMNLTQNDTDIGYDFLNFRIQYRLSNFCVGETVGRKTLP